MKKEMNLKRKRRFFAALILCLTLCTIPALAADDPLTIVNNLSDFIFSCIKAVGVIILGWGIVQVGMSVQSHDASQRSQGFLCLLGGLLIAFAKEILSAIGLAFRTTLQNSKRAIKENAGNASHRGTHFLSKHGGDFLSAITGSYEHWKMRWMGGMADSPRFVRC